MPLMTGDEYVRSLQKIKMRIFLFGEEIDNPVGNPILQPAVNSVKATYDLFPALCRHGFFQFRVQHKI